VAVWDLDPARDRWDDATIATFARLGYDQQASWFRSNPTLTSRTPRWSETGHTVVWNARWSPDGRWVGATGDDGTLSIYDAATGAVSMRQTIPKGESLHGLAWHPGSRWLAAGGSDARIYVYDAVEGVLYDTIEGHADVVTALAWSPDGETLASTAGGPLLKQTLVDVSDGPDQTIRLWRWR
jgi:WD40 repeat protein